MTSAELEVLYDLKPFGSIHIMDEFNFHDRRESSKRSIPNAEEACKRGWLITDHSQAEEEISDLPLNIREIGYMKVS